MPCNDITEQIRIILDGGERLLSYTLLKKVCGKEVGNQLTIKDDLYMKHIDEILAMEKQYFFKDENNLNDIDIFLRLKHLFAVQKALSVYRGADPGGPNDLCSIAEISHCGDNIIIDADIRIDILTSKIESCGFCRPET